MITLTNITSSNSTVFKLLDLMTLIFKQELINQFCLKDHFQKQKSSNLTDKTTEATYFFFVEMRFELKSKSGRSSTL
jgi:hypothetical protein